MHGYKWPINCTRTRMRVCNSWLGRGAVPILAEDTTIAIRKLPATGYHLLEYLLPLPIQLSICLVLADRPTVYDACGINRPLVTMHD